MRGSDLLEKVVDVNAVLVSSLIQNVSHFLALGHRRGVTNFRFCTVLFLPSRWIRLRALLIQVWWLLWLLIAERLHSICWSCTLTVQCVWETCSRTIMITVASCIAVNLLRLIESEFWCLMGWALSRCQQLVREVCDRVYSTDIFDNSIANHSTKRAICFLDHGRLTCVRTQVKLDWVTTHLARVAWKLSVRSTIYCKDFTVALLQEWWTLRVSNWTYRLHRIMISTHYFLLSLVCSCSAWERGSIRWCILWDLASRFEMRTKHIQTLCLIHKRRCWCLWTIIFIWAANALLITIICAALLITCL